MSRKSDIEAWMELQLKIERTRALRDVGMSLAQASVNQPLVNQALLIMAGGLLKGADRIAQQHLHVRGGLPTADAVGTGLWGVAGVNALGYAAKDIIQAIRGSGNGGVSVAFDVPESDTAYPMGLYPGGGSPLARSPP